MESIERRSPGFGREITASAEKKKSSPLEIIPDKLGDGFKGEYEGIKFAVTIREGICLLSIMDKNDIRIADAVSARLGQPFDDFKNEEKDGQKWFKYEWKTEK